MKHLSVLFFILLSSAACHAQKASKNEISVGYFPAGCFFDGKGFRISPFAKGWSPVLMYTRNHAHRIASSVMYASYYFGYPYDDKVSGPQVARRSIQRISLSGAYNLPAGWFGFRIKAGLNYCWGYRGKEAYYYAPSSWENWYYTSEAYGKWGMVTGCSIHHKIVWGLFGSFQADYVRMLQGIDPNQVYLSYSLGYRF